VWRSLISFTLSNKKNMDCKVPPKKEVEESEGEEND